jgi:hypothetical protein
MRKVRLAAAFAMVVTMMFGTTVSATATSVTPVVITGNVAHCPSDELLKLDPVVGGVYHVDGGVITVVVSGSYFSWSATGVEIDAVFVKGGPDTNLYDYDGATSGSNLSAPINPKTGKPYGLSHINFCGDDKKEPPKY